MSNLLVYYVTIVNSLSIKTNGFQSSFTRKTVQEGISQCNAQLMRELHKDLREHIRQKNKRKITNNIKKEID